ncbi:uncharacterized protein LOC101850549 [Aplysia californica]|uniref:Uncharacterized protein LOC101850549 n=1 Tax=Aplysia californica TaxID=6500 RepID=A0ABM0JI96_APLCA|nr:uncharacterized protein LOC101850549 [Aplysia californica]XP_005094254.1 uncharacterized protein LOC101850549 [Aplysia californica]
MRMFQVILVAVFIAGYAASDFHDENQQCESSLQTCAFPVAMKFAPHTESEESFISYVQSIPVNTVCTVVMEPFMQCVQTALDTVCAGSNSYIATEASNFLGVISYACGPAGRLVLESMKQSPCLNNAYAFEAAGNLVEMCQSVTYAQVEPQLEQSNDQETRPDPAIVCPLLAEMRACIVGGLGSICGDAFEEFFSQIWANLRLSMTGQYFDCGEGLKRAAIFKKRNLGSIFGL